VVEAEAVITGEVASVKQEGAHSMVMDVAEAGAPRVRRKINLDAKFVGNQIMKQWIADTDLMKSIKLKEDMQQPLHHLMVWTQTGIKIQGLLIMSQES
jgi:hypothetical protein